MNSEKELQKYNNDNLKNNEVFPFIDQMVNIFYNDQINELLNDSITGGYDKSIFLMFVVMYFGIHLKLENKDKDEKKQQIKYLMTARTMTTRVSLATGLRLGLGLRLSLGRSLSSGLSVLHSTTHRLTCSLGNASFTSVVSSHFVYIYPIKKYFLILF